ncbi:hypothetical protein ACFYWU_00510 [Streptomyces chrestomyceticus]|uniref:hypothetical protein n=1 Tax=Streptomyces chrestomyceticus TaxID=68185 RepID=UPI0036BD7D91
MDLAIGIGGIMTGLSVMAKALELTSPGMPWQAQVALLVTAAMLPMACYWLTVRNRWS